jgi:Na+-driven multidrug efflux pump
MKMQVIFYWLCYYLHKIKSNSNPEKNAFFILTMHLFFNFTTILIILRYIFKFELSHNEYTWIVIIYSIIAYTLNAIIFRKEAREKTKKEYVNIPEKQKKLDKIIFWSYMLLTLPLFCVVNYYLRN